MCSFLLRNDALWDIGKVHCEICATVQLVLTGLITHKISYEGANFNTNLLKVSYMGDFFNLKISYKCNTCNSWNKDKSLRCCILIMGIPKAGWKTVLILKQPISNHKSLVAHHYIGSSLAQVIPDVVLSTWPLILDFVDVGLKKFQFHTRNTFENVCKMATPCVLASM